MLDHRWDMMVDRRGFVHGFYRRLDDNGFLQIFHFWIDQEDAVHGPRAVTDFDYTGFWQNVSSTGVNLSQPRSFTLGDTIYLVWQEEHYGQTTRAMASQFPFTDWSKPREIDGANLFASDPEFERWAWDTRQEIWLTILPFFPNTSAGHPVNVVQIAPHTLPTPPHLTSREH